MDGIVQETLSQTGCVEGRDLSTLNMGKSCYLAGEQVDGMRMMVTITILSSKISQARKVQEPKSEGLIDTEYGLQLHKHSFDTLVCYNDDTRREKLPSSHSLDPR